MAGGGRPQGLLGEERASKAQGPQQTATRTTEAQFHGALGCRAGQTPAVAPKGPGRCCVTTRLSLSLAIHSGGHQCPALPGRATCGRGSPQVERGNVQKNSRAVSIHLGLRGPNRPRAPRAVSPETVVQRVWGGRSTQRALHGTPLNRAVTHSPASLGAKPWVGLPRSSAACLLRWHPDLRPSPRAPPLRSRLQTTLNAWTSLQEACSPPRA